jgi:hypothetical protein
VQLIPALTVERVPIGVLSEHPDNARHGDVDAIIESIQVHGQYAPLIAQRSTGRVLKGNHTLRALRMLARETVEVAYLDVDDDQALRILLVDNRSSDLGGYDYDALTAVIQSLGGDFAGTGYTPDDLKDAEAFLAFLTPRDAQAASAADDLPGWEAKGMRTILLSYSLAQHAEVSDALDRLARHYKLDDYSAVVARLAGTQ